MKLRFTLYLIGFLLLSCTRGEVETPAAPAETNRVAVTFGMVTPEMTETKALSDHEYTIREVLLMVFHDGQYAYYAEAHDLVRSGSRYSFGANLATTAAGVRVDIFAVANISATVKGDLDRLVTSMTIDEAKKQSYVRFENFITRRDLFPMTGHVEITGGLVNDGVQIPDLHMIRAFARVDVVAHPNIENRFRMHSTQAHHINDLFQLVPDEVTDHRVTAPSVPDDARDNLWSSAEYTVSGDRITGLYLPEADECTIQDKPTCLVIAGYYKNRHDLSYYRVDLKTDDAVGKILRNHKYTVTVTSVSGPGSPTVAEALQAPSEDINTYIVWEEDGSTTIYDKNGNEISLSDRTFTLHFAKGAMDVITVELQSLSGGTYTVEWADGDGEPVDPTGSSRYGYGQQFTDEAVHGTGKERFRVQVAPDGSRISVSALTENPGSAHRTGKLLVRTVGMDNNIMFNLSIDQATRAERTYVNLYNKLGMSGDVGDDIFSAEPREGTHGNMLRDLLKHEGNFGPAGTISFDGFKLAGQEYQLKITNYLIRMFDVVMVPYAAADAYLDAEEAEAIINWLKNDPHKVLVAYTGNLTLMQALGVVPTSVPESHWTYKISPAAPAEILNGPFGPVNTGQTISNKVNSSAYTLSPSQSNGNTIEPLLTVASGNISIGVDRSRRIVYLSDFYLFDDVPLWGGPYGLLTGNGIVNPANDLDLLVANLWAWIAETCLGDRYDPDIPRQ